MFKTSLGIAFAGLLVLSSIPASAAESGATPKIERVKEIVLAQGGRSCKAARSCQEAVEMWCGGYSRADGDHDGIPCENVCRSRSQVEAIKKDLGC